MNPDKKTIEISKNTYEEYSQIVLNKILKIDL